MNQLRKFLPLVFICSAMVISALSGVAGAAGTATMYFVPASGSVVQGGTLSVGVYEDSGTDSVNAVQANFSYPTALLTFAGYSNSSAFPVETQSSGSGGNVAIQRGAITPVSGAQLIATVRFTAAATTGTANLSFTSGSAVVRSTDNQYETLSTTPSSYTVTAPATPPPSGGGGSSPPPAANTKPKTSTPTTTTPSSQPSSTSQAASLTISDVKVLNISPSTATIQWKTSAPATSEVYYGVTSNYELSNVNKTLVTEHSLSLSSNTLVANRTYHFIVKSVDGNGTQATSSDMTFHTSQPVAVVHKSNSSWFVLGGAVAALGVALGAFLHFRGRNNINNSPYRNIGYPSPPVVPPVPPAGVTPPSDGPVTTGQIITPNNEKPETYPPPRR